METKLRRAGCTREGKPLPFVTAMLPLIQATLVRGALVLLH
jgi:hypothetical protein